MGNNDKKIITISREFGSGGRLIGKRLAEKLDVPFYDKQLLDRIAEESGFSKEMIKGAEMKAKNSFLYSLASAMGTSESGPESLSLNERFFPGTVRYHSPDRGRRLLRHRRQMLRLCAPAVCRKPAISLFMQKKKTRSNARFRNTAYRKMKSGN